MQHARGDGAGLAALAVAQAHHHGPARSVAARRRDFIRHCRSRRSARRGFGGVMACARSPARGLACSSSPASADRSRTRRVRPRDAPFLARHIQFDGTSLPPGQRQRGRASQERPRFQIHGLDVGSPVVQAGAGTSPLVNAFARQSEDQAGSSPRAASRSRSDHPLIGPSSTIRPPRDRSSGEDERHRSHRRNRGETRSAARDHVLARTRSATCATRDSDVKRARKSNGVKRARDQSRPPIDGTDDDGNSHRSSGSSPTGPKDLILARDYLTCGAARSVPCSGVIRPTPSHPSTQRFHAAAPHDHSIEGSGPARHTAFVRDAAVRSAPI